MEKNADIINHHISKSTCIPKSKSTCIPKSYWWTCDIQLTFMTALDSMGWSFTLIHQPILVLPRLLWPILIFWDPILKTNTKWETLLNHV